MVDKVTVYFTKKLIGNSFTDGGGQSVYFTNGVSPMADKVTLFISQMESRVSLMEERMTVFHRQRMGRSFVHFTNETKKIEEDDDDEEDKEWTFCMSDL